MSDKSKEMRDLGFDSIANAWDANAARSNAANVWDAVDAIHADNAARRNTFSESPDDIPTYGPGERQPEHR